MLDDAPMGRPLQVLRIRAGSPALSRRLAELGLRPGAALQVLARTSGGGALLGLGDDRLAVARSVLAGVEVEIASSGAGGAAGLAAGAGAQHG
jgi:ferrous iron transport protein A